jgi:hypothetical protein
MDALAAKKRIMNSLRVGQKLKLTGVGQWDYRTEARVEAVGVDWAVIRFTDIDEVYLDEVYLLELDDLGYIEK